jgi:nucleoside-diphosphate-sugar epimerase
VKYLVLGSEGQIGKPLTHYLKSLGHQVCEFDLERNIDEDLRKANNVILEKSLDECDFVFFLAFDVGGSRYLEKYQHTFNFLNNNISLLKNTFELIKKYRKPFIFSSSQMSNMDYSPYGAAKTVGECYTKALNGLTVKFWNVYGCEHNIEKAHVITDFILKAINTKNIKMLTDGTEERQFLHVEDCSRALYVLSQDFANFNPEKNYHITSFQWNSILEIAEIISELIGDVSISPAQKKDLVQQNKKNEPDEYILNFWQPTLSLREGIRSIINEIQTTTQESQE